jgi:Ribbon-helix-helix protein, copG family
MDEKEQKVITFKLSDKETELLDERASQANMSRSDYLRSLIATPRTTNKSIEETLRYLLYMVESLHLSTYLIAEKSAVLYPEQLQEILQDATGQAGLYVHRMEQNFARLQQLLAAITKSEA